MYTQFLIAVAYLMTTARPVVQDPGLSPDQLRLFAIIDRFDSCDTSHLQFIRASISSRTVHNPGEVSFTTQYGFLVVRRDGQLAIRCLDLTEHVLRPQHIDGTNQQRAYEQVDLSHYVRDLVTTLGAKSDNRPAALHYYTPDAIMHPRVEALMVARACAQRGMTTELNQLWSALGPIESLQNDLAIGIANLLCLEFAQLELDRSQLLKRHEEWTRCFTEPTSSIWVGQRLKALARMEKDEEVHDFGVAWTGAIPANSLFVALNRALRETLKPFDDLRVNGYYIESHEGGPHSTISPAESLVGVGWSAVPYLINRLDDDSLTRCVFYFSRYGGSFCILTVGELAEQILIEITGIRLTGGREAKSKAYTKYCRSVAKKGERAAMGDIVASGSDQSAQIAARFVKRWPSDVERVFQGFHAARDARVMDALLSSLGHVRTDAVTDFLVDELHRAQYLACQSTAAQLLLERGNRDGLDLLIGEWDSLANLAQISSTDPAVAGGPPEARHFGKIMLTTRELRPAVDVLLSSGDLSAVSRVATRVMSQDTGVRSAILASLQEVPIEERYLALAPKMRERLRTTIEDLLVHLLDDDRREVSIEQFTQRGTPVEVYNVRNNDRAARLLAEEWPLSYKFDISLIRPMRDRQIGAIKNAYSVARGLATVPKVERPREQVVCPEADVALDRLLKISDRSQWSIEMQSIMSIGLRALPAVRKRLSTLSNQDEVKEVLTSVGRSLSQRIRSVKVDIDPSMDAKALNDYVKEIDGTSLTPSVINGILARMKPQKSRPWNATVSIIGLQERGGIDIVVNVESQNSQQGMFFAARAGNTGVGVVWKAATISIEQDEARYIDEALSFSLHEDIEIEIICGEP